jgi:multiple sugar transport system substrate-binding protein
MNNPTKFFKVGILVLFGFFAIAGLVVFSTFRGFGGGGQQVGAVTIWGTLPADQMEAVLSDLRASDQAYGNVTYKQKNETTFDADLANALASGTGPDAIIISQEQLTTEQSKLTIIPFSTIPQRTYLDSYLPIDELFLASSGMYAIPFAVDPLVLYYNRSALVNAGISTPPTTWESMTDLAERLSVSSAGTVAQSTIPFGVYDNVENARAIVSMLFLQAGNPITQVSSRGVGATLSNTSDGTVSGAEAALNFYTQFADPVKAVYSWNRAFPSARQAFLAGKLAFYPGFASELPQLKAANPNLDFDMAPMPQPKSSNQRITYGKAYALAVPKASHNVYGAVSVALALSKASLAPRIAQTFSMAPPFRAALTPSTSDRYAPVFFPQALIARGWLSPSPARTDSIFSTMITSVTSGGSPAIQALGTANQALDASY